MKLRFLHILLFTVLALTLASCSPSKDASEEDGISVVDALGRDVTLPRSPQRVAALIGSFAEVWQLAGGELVAAASDAWEDFGLTLECAVNLGGAHSPNLELLLSASPDLVLASASTASNVELCDSLEAAGVTVVYFDVDSFYDYLEMLELCTLVTGREDLYKKNGLDLLRGIEELKAAYADCPKERRTVLLLRASKSSVKAKGSEGTILGEMLADMGCINIADSDSTLLESLGMEAIIARDPYHVFAVTMGNDTDAAVASLRELIEGDPAWQTLTAVREGRVHLMDKRLFNLKPNARWREAYEVLYNALTE